MPSQPPRDEELTVYRRWNDGVAANLDASTENTPFHQYQRWQSRGQFDLVLPLPASAFAVPDRLQRFLPARDVEMLAAILDDVRTIHERYVGVPRIAAAIEMNASEEQRDLYARGIVWADRVVRRRLARPSPRDQGCPFRRFVRLHEELVPVLDMLGIEAADDPAQDRAVSCAGHLLGRTADYLTWTYYDRTWRPLVPYLVARSPHPALMRLDPHDLDQCNIVASIYRFGATAIWDDVLPRLAQEWSLEPADPDTALGDLERMAEDLVEMKPFLMRDFDPLSATFELPDGQIGWFLWDVNDRVGCVNITKDEAELHHQLDEGIAESMLVLDSRGRLACTVRPWLDIRTPPEGLEPPHATALNLAIVERLHAMFYRRFDKLDLGAIVQNWAGRPEPEDEDPVAEEEVIAASVVVRDRRASRAPRLSSGMRLNALLSLLEGRLGATSRDGKGSELVLFRPGGRVTTIGRHKRNPLVSAAAIRRVLKALGITVEEWLGAMG